MSITVLYGSTRENGNTELLTEYAIQGKAVNKVFLKDYRIQDIVDQRHEINGFTKVYDEYDQVIDLIIESEVLIFATPIYWYGMSGVMKTFIDRWSQTVRDNKYPNFKESMAQKKVYVLAVGGDQPTKKGLPLIQQFEYICEFIGLSFQDYILGEGAKPKDILKDTQSIQRAKQLSEILREYEISN